MDGFRSPGYTAGRAGRSAGRLPGSLLARACWRLSCLARWLVARLYVASGRFPDLGSSRFPCGVGLWAALGPVLPHSPNLRRTARLGVLGPVPAASPPPPGENGRKMFEAEDGLGRVDPPVAPGPSVEGGDGNACLAMGAPPLVVGGETVLLGAGRETLLSLSGEKRPFLGVG